MVAANFSFLVRVMLLTGAALLYMFASPARAADDASSVFVVPAESLFVPQNFDDNDQSEIVLEGWLQSGCDRLLDPQIEVLADLGIINVAIIATRDEIAECLPVITRFTTVVQLGVLPQGRWEVRTNGGNLTKHLPVAEAPSRGPEQETYADVDRVWVDYAPDREFDSRWMVVLMGRFHTTCEEFDMIRVVDNDSTIEVIPTTRKNGEVICAPQMVPFIERRFMPDITAAGRYLLRARSAGGGAVNYVFSAFE